MAMERNAWEERVKDLLQEYNSGYASIDTIREEIETELADDIPKADMENIMRDIQEMEDKEVELMSIGDFESVEDLDEVNFDFFENETLW